jgi:hypothetical protein
MCVWGQARSKRAERSGSTRRGVRPSGRVARRREGDEQGAGTLRSLDSDPGGPGADCRAARRHAPVLVEAASGPHWPPAVWGSRSRCAIGPVHPSWFAPDLVTHSSTKQVCVDMGTSCPAELPPGGGVKKAREPRRRVSRMYRNSGVAL